MSSPTTTGVPGPAPVADAGSSCPNCSFYNPPGFAFCGRCGQRLGQPPETDVGSAQTVFADHAPEELARLREQGIARGLAVHDDDEDEVPGMTEPLMAAAPPSGMPPRRPPPSRPPVPTPSPSMVGGPSAKLVMLGPDGAPIGERVLAAGETLSIGRAAGPPWDEDAYLDENHGALTPTPDGILAEDTGSLNGIYVKLKGRVEVQNGDQFRVGQELLQYEDLPEPTPTDDGTERMGSPNPGYWGRLSLMVESNVASQAFPIEGEGITIGREQGDITFPTDGYVSGSHCRIVGDDTGVYLEDLGSSNGTYMRVRSGAVLPYGSLVLIGQKLFQLERN
ncbi:MAG: FHA domain-containing protein [Myxococcales bacterium]|nr:FHA domain-containing protein [Myxococcales bacterium]